MATIFDFGAANRSAIAASSGLSLGAVSTALEALVRKGLVREAGKSAPATGRPSVVYELTEGAGSTVGIAFDVESTMTVVMDATKRVVSSDRRSRAVGVDGPDSAERLLETMAGVCEEAISAVPGRTLGGIGMGLAGLVNPRAGIWVTGMRIRGVDHVRVREFLEERFGIPIVIDDVARAAAYFESRLGDARDTADVVVLHIGMGVGSGLIIDGKLFGGHHGVSGEIGHLTVDPYGYRCLCGKVGCLETVLSLPGIVRRVNDRLVEASLPPLRETSNDDNGFGTIEEILRLAESGDRLIQSVLFEIGGFLGDAIAKVVSLFDPERLVITGIGSLLGSYLQGAMLQTMNKLTVAAVRPELKVTFASYEPHHEAAGAALLAMQRALQYGNTTVRPRR